MIIWLHSRPRPSLPRPPPLCQPSLKELTRLSLLLLGCQAQVSLTYTVEVFKKVFHPSIVLQTFYQQQKHLYLYLLSVFLVILLLVFLFLGQWCHCVGGLWRTTQELKYWGWLKTCGMRGLEWEEELWGFDNSWSRLPLPPTAPPTGYDFSLCVCNSASAQGFVFMLK